MKMVSNRQDLISDTIKKISQLPDAKIVELNDFADFLLSKLDDRIIVEDIQKLTSDSKSFEYLNDEEVIYSVEDLKERYK